MVLAGSSKAQLFDGIKAAVDKKELGAPASGSMCYMMSKEAYLTDRGNHNLSHLMFELPSIKGAAWGANPVDAPILFQDAPIFFVQWDPAPMTEFYVGMSEWSDGTSVTAATADDTTASHPHNH
jgi:hypothetical protein